ncbi:small GTPase [Mayamaea pseudoterrestris]|nr:small GTPase [Mayamaea pseudoterrestris]
MSSIYSTLSSIWSSILYKLGLWEKQASLLVLGLDNAGKTTLLHSLSTGSPHEHRTFPPTDRPRLVERFRYKNVSFKAWDLGGHEAVRHLWSDYYSGDDEDGGNTSPSSSISALLFLVDAADEPRLEEAGYELDNLLASPLSNDASAGVSHQTQQSSLYNVPVAILLNKCDLPTAVSSQAVCEKIDFQRLVSMHATDKIAVFRMSVLTGQGYEEAFRWIYSFI